MARQASQIRGGFYPASDEAMRMAANRLEVPADGKVAILDPCAGKGKAISTLAEALSISPSCVWAIEMEGGRSRDLKENLVGAHILAPCDFLCAKITASSFSFAWVNSPYDDELGGGQRVEYTFLTRATQLLAPGGIMALACPEKVAGDFSVKKHFLSWYERIGVDYFPPPRQYNEVIIWGRKRSRPIEWPGYPQFVKEDMYRGKFQIPPAGGPKRFEKATMTAAEAMAAIAKSKLRSVFETVKPVVFPPPPLELSKGQMALVLAGGFLNTTLKRPGEAPILIKATPFKEQYLKEQSSEIKNEGTDKEKAVDVTIYSERIKLKVRIAEENGTIHEVM